MNRAGGAWLMPGAYFLCAAATLLLTRFDDGLAIMWPAGALLFARLATAPRRHWRPVILRCLAAGMVAGATFGFGRGVAIPLAVISIAEACAITWLLKRLSPRFERFASLAGTLLFIGIAGVIVPAAGACLSAAAVRAAAGIEFCATWRNWYAGHALGFLAFGPPAVLAMRGEYGRWSDHGGRRGLIEAVGLLGAVFVASLAAFAQNEVLLVVLPFVPMVAATVRLGRFGAIASVVILMGVGLSCSLAGFGPTTLLHGSQATRFQILQLYFATVVLVLLPLAAELKARRRLLDRLRETEALHRLVLDRTGDVVLRLGLDGTVRYASPSVQAAWGYGADELYGRPAFDLVPAEDLPGVIEARSRALASTEGNSIAEYRVRRKDGTLVWVESYMRATVDEHGRATGTVSIIRETTERRRLVEDLARQAATDPLTGLSNRRTFDDALATWVARPDGGGCLAMFDLDHFKQVNDRHGHAVGDRVLVSFARLLKLYTRDGDVAARIGGEEFAVLLAGATLDQASGVCERIRTRLAQDGSAAAGGDLRTTVSVGLAPLAGMQAEAVLAAADAALYRAKHEGRNRLALAA